MSAALNAPLAVAVPPTLPANDTVATEARRSAFDDSGRAVYAEPTHRRDEKDSS